MSTMTGVLDRFLDGFSDCLTPEVADRIANLQIDPSLQTRLNELASKANAGTLTPDEDAEYGQYVEAIDLLAILQAKARRYLRRHAS